MTAKICSVECDGQSSCPSCSHAVGGKSAQTCGRQSRSSEPSGQEQDGRGHLGAGSPPEEEGPPTGIHSEPEPSRQLRGMLGAEGTLEFGQPPVSGRARRLPTHGPAPPPEGATEQAGLGARAPWGAGGWTLPSRPPPAPAPAWPLRADPAQASGPRVWPPRGRHPGPKGERPARPTEALDAQ